LGRKSAKSGGLAPITSPAPAMTVGKTHLILRVAVGMNKGGDVDCGERILRRPVGAYRHHSGAGKKLRGLCTRSGKEDLKEEGKLSVSADMTVQCRLTFNPERVVRVSNVLNALEPPLRGLVGKCATLNGGRGGPASVKPRLGELSLAKELP